MSTGPAGGNGAVDAVYEGASTDGGRMFFRTAERLVSTDTDMFEDVYVRRIVAPVSTARPTISGSPLVGRRLTCSPGGWDHNPTRLTYRWNRAGVPIPGATSSTYTLVAADGARSITCTVTASNGAGARSATSASVTPRFPGACANLQTGGAGADRLTGLTLGDRLRGLGGQDVLLGRAGADCLSGGTGNDVLTGGRTMTRSPATPATTRCGMTPAWTASPAGWATTRSTRVTSAVRRSVVARGGGIRSALTAATGSSAARS